MITAPHFKNHLKFTYTVSIPKDQSKALTNTNTITMLIVLMHYLLLLRIFVMLFLSLSTTCKIFWKWFSDGTHWHKSSVSFEFRSAMSFTPYIASQFARQWYGKGGW